CCITCNSTPRNTARRKLLLMQQFTGMNVIMYYAPKIFELAGYTNTTEQMWGTVIVGLTNVLATFIAIGLVDRWGRKPTLTLGFLVMAAGMGVLGTMMHEPGTRRSLREWLHDSQMDLHDIH
ncbi:MFS transporter, partial [Escherichia sp. R-CC3]